MTLRDLLWLAAVIVFAVAGVLLVMDACTFKTGLALDSFALAAATAAQVVPTRP